MTSLKSMGPAGPNSSLSIHWWVLTQALKKTYILEGEPVVFLTPESFHNWMMKIY